MKKLMLGISIWSGILNLAASQTLQTSQIFTSEDYIFFESPYQPELILYTFKTSWKVLSETRGPLGNTGIPGVSQRIQTGWRIQGDVIDLKIENAKRAVPKWRDFTFVKLRYESSGCSLYGESDAIKLLSGERTKRVDVTETVCTMDIAYKESVEMQVKRSLERGTLIDQGLADLKLTINHRIGIIKLNELQNPLREALAEIPSISKEEV